MLVENWLVRDPAIGDRELAWSGRYLLGVFNDDELTPCSVPIEGHSECLCHLFAYLGKYQNAKMLYDPTEPHINSAAFQKQDWTFPL